MRKLLVTHSTRLNGMFFEHGMFIALEGERVELYFEI